MQNTKTQFIKDLKEKDHVSTAFLIKYSGLGTDKNGKPYMNLVLMDNSGEIEARIWEDVSRYASQAVKDTFVWIDGRCQSYQGRKQVIISKLQMLREDDVDSKQFIVESGVDVEPLYADLLKYCASVKDPFYRGLLEGFYKDDQEIVEKLKRAPAAKTFHHSCRGGLLTHIVSIAGMLDATATNYGKRIDRDLLVTGGLLHDIGKIRELSFERVTDYSTEGKLIGHIVIGTEMIDRKIKELESQPERFPGEFPEEKRLLLKHMILAHHGELEFGSPKRPKCLEALILHYIDDLDSKIESIGSFIEQDQTPGRWTAYNRNYDRFFMKPAKVMEPESG